MTITAQELQHILNQFQNLEGVEVVTSNSPIITKDSPATIKGAIKVHGEYYVYDMEVDLSRFKNADDVLKLVGQLNEAFKKIKTH